MTQCHTSDQFSIGTLRMETLSPIDAQNLNLAIQQLYALNDFDRFGMEALTIVHRLIPSEIPVFHITNMQTFEIQDTFLADFPGLTPELQAVKFQTIGEHPIAQNMKQTMHGTYKISDFVSSAEFHAREGIYQQFFRPLELEDQLMIFLLENQPITTLGWEQLTHNDAIVAGFALNRSCRSFTERDRLMLNLLRPHLFQAYQNAQRYHQVTQNLGQLQRSLHHLGLIIVATTGLIQWMTPQAEQWLGRYFEPSTARGYLPEALWMWVKDQTSGVITHPHSSKVATPFQIELACKRLIIRLVIEPDRSGYNLVLEEQRRSNLQALETLGLSQRETEVLGWLMQGKDNKSIAILMAVGGSTIRKHLENIYRKLGVQSRTEAVSYALEKIGLFPPPS
jgi:DNA-binding CsgD family transcriptional regulator